MRAPVAMLSRAAGSKPALVIAALIGLAIVAALKNQGAPFPPPGTPR